MGVLWIWSTFRHRVKAIDQSNVHLMNDIINHLMIQLNEIKIYFCIFAFNLLV